MRLSWSLDRLQSTSVSAWGARRAFTVCGGLCTGNHLVRVDHSRGQHRTASSVPKPSQASLMLIALFLPGAPHHVCVRAHGPAVGGMAGKQAWSIAVQARAEEEKARFRRLNIR